MLKNQFNLEYRYLASKKVGTERVKEIYVYLYRADKVQVVKNFGVYPDPEDDFIHATTRLLINSFLGNRYRVYQQHLPAALLLSILEIEQTGEPYPDYPTP